MFIQATANLGIIIMNIYLLFKFSNGFLEKEEFSKWQVVQLIALQTLVGILLIYTSTVVNYTRVDYRFLLYSISMMYLGKKVTLPTMFLVAIVRFLFDQTISAWVNLFSVAVLIVTLPIVYHWGKKKLSDFWQWMAMVTYCLLISILTYLYLLPTVQQSIQVSFILAITSYLFAFIAFKILHDMQGMMKMAHMDSLTKLHNTRKLQEDIIRFERMKKSCSVISFDIDHFKKYNDSYGHAVGDYVLEEVSKALVPFYGSSKRFYRAGGEEFVVLISSGDALASRALAEKIHQQIQAMTIQLSDGTPIRVTISMGLANQKEEEPLLETIRRADMALYQAKNNGRNQIAVQN